MLYYFWVLFVRTKIINLEFMKQVIRFGCTAFVLFVFASTNSIALNRGDAVRTWMETMVKAKQPYSQLEKSPLRSASIQELRLDSLTISLPEDSSETGLVVQDQKIVFHYNEYGLVDEFTQWMDETGSGIVLPFERTISTYDAYGHKTSDSLYASLDNDVRLYLKTIKEYRYSPSGVLLRENSKSRINEQLGWTGDYGTEYQYDILGRLAVKREYTLTDESSWTLVRKTDFTYNSSNKPLTEIHYYWDLSKNDWTGMDQKEHLYDDSQRDTMVLYSSYYPLENRWAIGNRDVNRYDASGHLLLRMKGQWNESTSSWMESGKEEYAYDDFGYQILEATYNWDGDIQGWLPKKKEEWKYDQVGNLLSNTIHSFLEDDMTWRMASITDFQYNFQERAVKLDLLFGPDGIPCYNLMTGASLTWSFPAMDTSIVLANLTFHYSPKEILVVHSIKMAATSWRYESNSKTLLFDPSLKVASVQVFDVQGRLLIRSGICDRLSVSHLRKGMYMIELVSQGKTERGKIMVD